MKLKAKVDARSFYEKVREFKRRRPKASRETIAEVAAVALRKAINFTTVEKRIDTARYIRAWQMAYNDLGVGVIKTATLTPGKRRNQIIKRLTQQLQFWQKIEQDLKQKYGEALRGIGPGSSKRFREAKKLYDRAQAISMRAEFYLQRAASGGRFAPLLYIPGRATKRAGVSNVGRVYTKTFGGRSVFGSSDSVHYVDCRNLEPHARLVEYGFKRRALKKQAKGQETLAGMRETTTEIPGARIVARSIADIRVSGVRTIRSTYLSKARLPKRKGASL